MPKCPRCKSSDLTRGNDSNSDITFYECANCVWAFAQEPGESLHDRWLSPISIALYGQIFELEPEKTGRDAAVLLFEQRRDLVSWLIYEIRRELKSPTQKVSEIHKFLCRDEMRLRRHLADLADHLAVLRDEGNREAS